MDVDGADLDEARCTLGPASELECLGDVSDTATETQVTPGGPCACVRALQSAHESAHPHSGSQG
jgi:hypothetical protein